MTTASVAMWTCWVRTPRLLDNRTWLAAKLAARAERLLGGQRVEVLLLYPETPMQAVHAVALPTGISL